VTEPQVRVYKLEIIYPEGCGEPGWYPALWTDPEWLKTLTREQKREIKVLLRKPFQWPHERLFLSRSGAVSRPMLLRCYGAEAEVHSSDPVIWPERRSYARQAFEAAEAEVAAADLAAEEARQEAARAWAREHSTMYVSDTARAAAEGERFRR
jgi:hypothetical protein